jgi:hypothetical protein
MKLSEGLLHRYEPDKRSLIFNTANGHIHVLNQSATMMLEVALSSDDLTAVQPRLHDEFSGYDISPENISHDYREFVSDLVAKGFLQAQ